MRLNLSVEFLEHLLRKLYLMKHYGRDKKKEMKHCKALGQYAHREETENLGSSMKDIVKQCWEKRVQD